MQSPISSVFLAWLHKHGVLAHGIEAALVVEGWRGVAATRELPAGMSSVWENFHSVFQVLNPLKCSSHTLLHATRYTTMTAGALLLQVPEAMLMTTTSAARDELFVQTMGRYAHTLTPEQVSLPFLSFSCS